jgi:hypothetical protein
MVRQGRVNDVYFRHEGKTDRDLYWRIRPQAIRFQQANKGSVTDTLGGYFREVMYAGEEQYNGLLLPELSIEGETGVAYRRELNTINWIWQHHADSKEDGTPADTWFYDLSDYYQGNSGGALSSAIESGSIDGLDLGGLELGSNSNFSELDGFGGIFDNLNFGGVQQYAESYDSVTNLLNERSDTIAPKNKKVESYAPRAYKIEILSFSWDDSVSDPMRMRFAFRCKILYDLYWDINAVPTAEEKLKSISDFGNEVFNDQPIA